MDTLADTRSTSRDLRAPIIPHDKPFQQRVDRYDRPFGERISAAASRPTGPRNKITLAGNLAQQYKGRGDHARSSDQRDHVRNSPPHSRRRLNNQGETRGEENNVSKRQSPRL